MIGSHKTRTPAVGDPLYLDGFWYQLGAVEPYRGSDGTAHPVRSFHRPDVFALRHAQAMSQAAKARAREREEEWTPGPLPEIDETFRRNFNYKAEGQVLEAHFVWREPAELVELLDAQADTLIASGGALGKVWARACRALQRTAFKDRKDGCWTIQERRADLEPTEGLRLLLKPTAVRTVDPETKRAGQLKVAPRSEAECAAIAGALLRSEDPSDLIAQATSIPWPKSLQIVRW